ncbi:MAG: hypothetical protein COB40_06670, partial [Marinosulfonomonas sp.]
MGKFELSADLAKPGQSIEVSKDWRQTEQRSPRYQGLADWPRADVLSALLDGQQRAIHCVHMALPDIERAVDAAVAR